MIEIAELAEQLKDVIEAAPVPLLMVMVPGAIICLATVAVAIATIIERLVPAAEEHH